MGEVIIANKEEIVTNKKIINPTTFAQRIFFIIENPKTIKIIESIIIMIALIANAAAANPSPCKFIKL